MEQGETERWRATFADEAFLSFRGEDYVIETLQDEYEFFAVLDERRSLIGCSTADVAAGEAVLCEVNSSNRFSDGLERSPVESVHYFEIVDDQIVRYRPTFTGASSIRTAWLEFARCAAEQNPEDGAAIAGFPGSAESAEIALKYMDDYFGSI